MVATLRLHGKCIREGLGRVAILFVHLFSYRTSYIPGWSHTCYVRIVWGQWSNSGLLLAHSK